MTINLPFIERIMLSNLLPEKAGSLKEMIRINKIRAAIRPTDEDYALAEFEASGNGAKWNVETAPDVDFDFSDSDLSLIATSLELLEASGEVPASEAFYNLYIKLVDAGMPCA